MLVRSGKTGTLYIGVVAGTHPSCIPVVVDNGAKARPFDRTGKEMFSPYPAMISPMDTQTRGRLMKRRNLKTLRRLIADDVTGDLLSDEWLTTAISKVRSVRRSHDKAQKASWDKFCAAYEEATKREGLIALPIEEFITTLFARGVTIEYLPSGKLHIHGTRPDQDVIMALQYREQELLHHYRSEVIRLEQSGLPPFEMFLGESEEYTMPEFLPAGTLPLARLHLEAETVAPDDGDPFAE